MVGGVVGGGGQGEGGRGSLHKGGGLRGKKQVVAAGVQTDTTVRAISE